MYNVVYALLNPVVKLNNKVVDLLFCLFVLFCCCYGDVVFVFWVRFA